MLEGGIDVFRHRPTGRRRISPLLGTRLCSIPTLYDRYSENKSLGQSKFFSSDLIQMRFFQYNIALQPIESPLA